MMDALDDVLAYKASSKSARDDNDLEGAIADLDDAISILKGLMPEASDRLRLQLESELADCYGMMGGIHKRWALMAEGDERAEHLRQSVQAYDEGFSYEKDLEVDEASTYNRINRLVGRVLLDPSVLGTDRPADGLDVPAELRRAEEILVAQLATVRKKDPWGYCDLGMIRLLLGSADATSAYRELDRLRPPPFVYESALATLQPLAAAAGSIRPDLSQALVQLERGASRA
jgi:hypothetical protein